VAAARLPAVATDQTLPPQDVNSVRRIYDEAFASMGLRLTRAALIDLEGGRYEPSPDGRHLALYVEPIDPAYSTDDYAERLWTLSALVTPDVFERWPELESYDICQEPHPDVNDDPEPPPVTQLNITRPKAALIDWAGGDLVELLIAARTDNDVRVIINRAVRESPVYAEANTAARAATGAGDTPVLSAPPTSTTTAG